MIGFGQGWEKRLGGIYNEFAMSVQQTIDGGYIIAGYSYKNQSTGDPDVFLLKTDGNGDSLWNQTFGGQGVWMADQGYSVQQTTDGGYIIAGRKSDIGQGSDACLIKTDGNGIEQWTKTFGGTSTENGSSVQQTTDGGYIVTGVNSNDVCLIKTDGNGIEQWNQTFGGAGWDYGNSVQQTTDGGYIITGATESFGNGLRDVYLIKTDGNGIEQWNQTFGGANSDWGRSVQQTTDGGYIITGRREIIFEESDVYLIKTDGFGIEQWSQNIGRTLGFGIDVSDEGYSVQQTTDGGYIITGYTMGITSGYDVYLIKTDNQGNVTSTFNIPINPNRKLQKTVDILGKQTKPQTNIPFIEIYDDGTVEKRIVIE